MVKNIDNLEYFGNLRRGCQHYSITHASSTKYLYCEDKCFLQSVEEVCLQCQKEIRKHSSICVGHKVVERIQHNAADTFCDKCKRVLAPSTGYGK